MSGPRLVCCHGPLPSFVVLNVLAAALFAAACRPAPPPAPAAVAVSPDTWAVVDGQTITKEHVERAYRRTQDTSQTLSNDEALTVRLGLLDDLIVQEILLAKARALKIDVSDSDLDKAYAEVKNNVPDETFQKELARRTLSAEDMRDGLRRELLTQKVIEQEVGSKVVVTDQEVTDFFNANRAQFNLAEESYRLMQIVVTPAPDPQVANRTGEDATTPQEAKEKVGMLMERLKAGTPFTELAMDYSEDPETAPRGGDLGLVPLSALKKAPAPLRDAVLKAKPGTANVVSAGGGHTILLVLAHEPAGQRDLSMPPVREGITARLRARREQLLRLAYLASVRGDADVVNYLARRLVESQGKLPL